MLVREYIDKVRQLLGERRYAYQKTFTGPLAEQVLKDLARFCRAHRSTYSADAREHAVAEGRREVWLRIEQHLKLSPDQLWELFSGHPAKDD